MGASEQIRVSPEIKAELEKQKEPDESYNDVLERLIEQRAERRREEIRDGAGLWAGTDAADGAKKARAAMRDEIGPDQ
jgi:predicted CopG family antitoxin